MEKALFWLTNHSSTDQTVELFDTKQVGVKIASPQVYNFTQDLSTILVGGDLPAGPYVFSYRNIDGTQSFINRNAGVNLSPADFQTNILDTFPNGTWTLYDLGANVFKVQGVFDENDLPDGLDTSASNAGSIAWSWDDFAPPGFGLGIITLASATSPGYFSIPGSPDVSVKSYNDFSYSDFVWSLVQRNYYVQKFEVFSESHQQLLSPFLFDRTTATGRVYQKVATPTIDPYQNQNVVDTPYMQGYLIDGFTSLKYVVKANQTLRFIMYYDYADLSTMLNRKKDE